MESTLLRKIGTVMIAVAMAVSAFGSLPLVTPHAHAAVSCGFSHDLTNGDTGEDVRCLQQYLNGAGFTIAASGPGAPGSETSLFRDGTAAAVKKWQAANGITATGTFGPISRAKYDSLVSGSPVSVPSTSASVNISQVATARSAILSAISKIKVAADDVDDDDTKAQDRLDDAYNELMSAMAAFMGGNFASAAALGASAQSDATEAIDIVDGGSDDSDENDAEDAVDELSDAIDDAQDDIDDAEDDGDDVDDANDYLDDARDSLDDAEDAIVDENWDDAVDAANDGMDSVESALHEIGKSTSGDATKSEAKEAISDAEDAISDAQDDIDDAEDDGDDVDDANDILDDARDKLDDAEDAYDDEEWDDAVDFAEDAQDLADDALDEI